MPIMTRSRVAAKAPAQRQPPVDGDAVARVAYALFERRGKVHGHDLEDWLEAERIVHQQRRSNGR